MVSNVYGGLANGFLNAQNIDPAAGIRVRFRFIMERTGATPRFDRKHQQRHPDKYESKEEHRPFDNTQI
jgi:hypothetical protein